MGYLGRRIGLSQDNGDSNPGGAGGAVGGGLLDLFTHGYFERQGDIYNNPGAAPSGLTATGGIISDYTSGSDVYRAHVFTSSGALNVTGLGDFGDTVEYLVVGGGGAGGEQHGGGGGAGGLVSNLSGYPLAQGAYSVSVGSYTVTIGAGGGAIDNTVVPGSDTNFYPTPVSYPNPTYIRAVGGGGGGSYLINNGQGGNGGSGGGEVHVDGSGSSGGAGQGYPGAAQQGFPGGESNPGPTGQGGGGGGAGGVGGNNTYPKAGNGGAGVQIAIAGPTVSTFTGVGALNPGPGEYQWFAGGGGGGTYNGGSGDGGDPGVGGGGHGGEPGIPLTDPSLDGVLGTGGGGGGSRVLAAEGGNGGSGVVVVRYQIATLGSGQKASGGTVSFYGGKVIHTFTTSGTFKNTSGSTLATEYVCVGGGGGGGGNDPNCWGSGGGGAGQMRTGSSTISAPNSPFAITISGGGTGGVKYDALVAGKGGNTTVAFPAGTVTGYGGGYGGSNAPASTQTSGTPGTNHPSVPAGSGSGGGANKDTPSTAGAGGPAALGAYPGGSMPGGKYHIGAGGGGAGGAGGRGSDGASTRSAPQIAGDGLGGVGLEVPATFQNPAVTYDGVHASSQWYLAGGGAGGMFNPSPQVNPDKGGKGGGGYGGGGAPGQGTGQGTGSKGGDGFTNTGGGGGGAGSFNDTTVFQGGAGGSGIVLIAYPST